MQEIINNIASPAWWFSAILIAILVNLVSAYAKPWTDKVLSHISTAWRNRTERDRQKFNAAVAILVQSPQSLAFAFEEEVRSRLRAIIFYLFVVIFLLFSIGLPTTPSASFERFSPYWLIVIGIKVATLLVFLFATMEHREAMRQSALLRMARRQLAEGSGVKRDG